MTMQISITDDAVRKGFADSNKLLVGGWSQGGLLTYLCSARNGLHGLGWRFIATVAGAGISNMESLAITSDMGSTDEAELTGGRMPWTPARDDTAIAWTARSGRLLGLSRSVVAEEKLSFRPCSCCMGKKMCAVRYPRLRVTVVP